MFLIVYAINSPLDEHLGQNLSILGTLMYVFFTLYYFDEIVTYVVSKITSNVSPHSFITKGISHLSEVGLTMFKFNILFRDVYLKNPLK